VIRQLAVSVPASGIETDADADDSVRRQLHHILALLLVCLVNLSADQKFRSPSKQGILCLFSLAYPCSRFKPLQGGGSLHMKPTLPMAIQSLAMKLITNLSHSKDYRSLLYRSELAHRARAMRSN